MENALLGVSGVPCNKGDFLRIATWNANPDTTVTYEVRYLFAPNGGSPAYNFEQYTVAASSGNTINVAPLTDGILISVTLTILNSNTQSGDFYAQISVRKGEVDQASNIVPLLSGYVSAFGSLNYPQDESEANNSGIPAILQISNSGPGPGFELSQTFGLQRIVRLTGGRIQLITSVALGSRQVAIILADGSGNLWQAECAGTQNPTETIDYFLTPTPLPLTAPAGVQYIPIPHDLFISGCTLSTVTSGLDLNDSFSAVQLNFESYALV